MTPEFKALLKKHPGPWTMLHGRTSSVYSAKGRFIFATDSKVIARAIVSLTKKVKRDKLKARVTK